MGDAIYTGNVHIDELFALIQACTFTEDKAYFLAEQLPEHIITSDRERENLIAFCEFKPELAFKKYTAGRIFDQQRELRWEKEEYKQLRVIYTGTERDLPTLQLKQRLDVIDAQKEQPNEHTYIGHKNHYYLFGTLLKEETRKKINGNVREGDFIELRIPRILRYPALHTGKAATRRVCLDVYEYLSPKTGQIEFFRFRDLVAGTEKETTTR